MVLAVLALPAVLGAQAGQVATTAVVKFQDKTGRRSALLEAKATDAVALALADSKEYLVTPSREVDRELQSLGLQPPLGTVEAVRLGKRLDVDSVCLGEVLKATVDDRAGSATIQLQLLMVDVDAGELLDGATVSTSTKAIPGWTGTEADILNEALRQGAAEVVERMLSTHIRRGTVEVVLPTGACEINLGSQDGVQPGMKLVVLRPVYLRELETVTTRKIGWLEVAQTQPDLSYANPVRNVAPRTGDYVLRVYEPHAVVEKATAAQDRTKFLWGAGAVALLLAFAGIATNGNEGSPPPTPISYLYQDDYTQGRPPTIRVEFMNRDKAFGHLLFRGPTRYFPADPYWLVEVSTRGMGAGTVLAMDDIPDAKPQEEITITVNYRDESGDWTTEDVDCTWVHPMLDAGSTYYHRVQRVTRPQFPPGTNPPISGGTGSTENVFQGPEDNEIDQGGDFPMLSQASEPAGPVTYITPVSLESPRENDVPQDPWSITFTCDPTDGADDYMIEVFDGSDPNGWGQPIWRRTGLRPTGSMVTATWQPATGDLAENSTYWWHAGARKSTEVGPRGQGVPRVGVSPHEITGYVLSAMRAFQTTVIPPPPPGATSASAKSAGAAAVKGEQAGGRGSRKGAKAGSAQAKPQKGKGAPARHPRGRGGAWQMAPQAGAAR